MKNSNLTSKRHRQSILFSLLLTSISFASVKAAYINELAPLFKNCLRTSSAVPCKKALAEVEALQRYAASKGNYPCQTRLLGLGADLTMTYLRKTFLNSYSLDLNEVKNFCSDMY